MKLFFVIQIFIFCSCSLLARNKTDEAVIVVKRYREFLLRTSPEVNVDSLLVGLSEDGRWKHINYGDKEPANWKISTHLKLLSHLSLAFANPKSKYYQSENLWSKISPALDYWLKNRYVSQNWWHNQIGVPRFMRDIIILIQERMSPAQRKESLEVMAQLRVLKPGEGANLIWSADLGFHHAALVSDTTKMDTCRKLLVNEVRVVEDGDGIKPDYSFQQHGPRLQMYQYGEAYFTVSTRLAWQMRGTCWAFPSDKINILSAFALEGWQWMARGIYTVPGTIDRSVSRLGALKSADVRYLIPFLQELLPEKYLEYQYMADIQNGKGNLVGFRHYPYADFSVYHCFGFSFFLKTISTRTLSTESINNENLKGHLLHSGDTYLVRKGSEYCDLMPMWDWGKLPGITNFDSSDHIERKPFVGSLGDGMSGLAVMDYSMVDKEGSQRLSARKLWACHNGWVICLLAGLEGESLISAPFTVLDQSRLMGEVFCSGSKNESVEEGDHVLEDVKWLLHNQMLYAFPEPTDLELKIGRVEGKWSDINKSESEQRLNDKIFLPLVRHDLSKATNFAYAFTNCSSPAKVGSVNDSAGWSVFRNDKDCQAIVCDDGLWMISFYVPGKIHCEALEVEVDKPCLIMLKGEDMTVGDPSDKVAQVGVKLNGRFRLFLL